MRCLEGDGQIYAFEPSMGYEEQEVDGLRRVCVRC
jgi:hypothetical protein